MIELYIIGKCHPKSISNIGGWGYVFFVEMGKGFGGGALNNTTEQELELTACLHALAHLIRTKNNTDQVIIYTSSNYFWNGVNRHQFDWQNNHWIDRNGKKVKYKNLWIEVFELISSCSATVKYISKNSYSLSESSFLAMQYAEKKYEEDHFKLELPLIT